ncbi:uncharacterized protein LOC113238291 [Hyposmocoma kahamanoa]|uniref:uncharacterized protein LOC113238291 n=1 Tax=Hyposmocoma kahamanoa TaxID=1477025 RepID=UPI000E6D6151|nr:uncharacterized protein LOC113238291 [Hyposmocoma kahamanoa]
MSTNFSVNLEALATRTESEEARRLRADSRLKREVENLKADLAAHRREFQDMRVAMRASMLETSAEASLRPLLLDGDMLDDLKRSIITSVSTMVNARLEAIEERLLPPVVHRPPLAADRRRTADADEARPIMVLSPLVDKRPVKPPAKPKPPKPPTRVSVVPAVVSKPNSGQRKLVPGPLQAGNASPAAEASSVAQENWITIEKKKKRRKRKKKSSADKGTSATPVPSKSAAVVISLLPEATQKGVTYAQALAEAEARVDLAGLGIEGVKFRQVHWQPTGWRNSSALYLTDWPASPDPQILRISASRVLTTQKVAAAVVRTGQCTTDLVKVLEIRPGPGGMGSVIVQCPISTAKTLAEAGRILVGWSSAKVQALEQRPLRCYRCLGLGHTRPMCTSGSSREDLCFRCGNEGHQASNCKGVLRCAVCADAGRPSDHRMGGRSRKPPPMKRKASNLNHCAGAQDLLLQSMAQWQIDLVVTCEPYYIPAHENWTGGLDGLIAVVRNGMGPPLTTLERGSVYVVTGWGEYIIIGTYFSPNRSLAEFETFLDSVRTAVLRQAPRQVIVLGDLNAKSQAWGNLVSDARGGAGGSVVDVSFATPAVALRTRNWRVVEDVETLSDYLYIRFEVSAVLGHSAPIRRPNRFTRWALSWLDREMVEEAAIVQRWFFAGVREGVTADDLASRLHTPLTAV